MTYIAWSVLEMDGKVLRHCRCGGDHAREMIEVFERLQGSPLRAPCFHKETICWISEVSQVHTPLGPNGDVTFTHCVDV